MEVDLRLLLFFVEEQGGFDERFLESDFLQSLFPVPFLP